MSGSENVNGSDSAAHWSSGTEGTFNGVDDVPIRYRVFLVDDAKAGIVISSGRTECMLKYHELVYELNHDGYSVYILDHRGQGFSGRMVEDTQIGHVEQFNDYVTDLNTFVLHVAKPANAGQNLFLVAHSMGGCIGSLYIETYTDDIDATILCSPMHQPSTGFIPERLAEMVADKKSFFKKENDYALGKGAYEDVGFDEIKDKQAEALTHSKQRYERVRGLYNAHSEVKIGGPSNNWVHEAIGAARRAREQADRIRIPVLLIQAGEDAIVTAEGQNEFVQNAGDNCKLTSIPGAYHELFVESDDYRNPTMTLIREFLTEQLGG